MTGRTGVSLSPRSRLLLTYYCPSLVSVTRSEFPYFVDERGIFTAFHSLAINFHCSLAQTENAALEGTRLNRTEVGQCLEGKPEENTRKLRNGAESLSLSLSLPPR